VTMRSSAFVNPLETAHWCVPEVTDDSAVLAWLDDRTVPNMWQESVDADAGPEGNDRPRSAQLTLVRPETD